VQHASWHLLKFTFFNGEAIYDTYWYQGESKGHAFMLRAYDIKKKYKDCFTFAPPEMLVPLSVSGYARTSFPARVEPCGPCITGGTQPLSVLCWRSTM